MNAECLFRLFSPPLAVGYDLPGYYAVKFRVMCGSEIVVDLAFSVRLVLENLDLDGSPANRKNSDLRTRMYERQDIKALKGNWQGTFCALLFEITGY